MRRRRPFALSPIEKQFRFADWIEQRMVIEERSGPEWVVQCPVCGKPKLAIHVVRRAYQCLSAACNFRGWSPKPLVMAVLNVPGYVAEEVMAGYAMGRQLGHIDPLSPRPIATYRAPHTLPQATLPLVKWELGQAQVDYLQRRGVGQAHAQGLGLGTVLSDGTGSKADRALSGRIIFPMWVPSGRLVFWAARSIRPDSPAKVINMPRPCRSDHGEWCACYHNEWGLTPVPHAAEAHEVVIGLHLVKPGEPVIIVEGPMDVAVCGPQFVGTLGAHLTEAQAMLIASSGASEAIILFDGDQGGIEAAPKAAAVLGQAMPVRWTTCPWGKDPGDLGRNEALRAAHTSVPLGGQAPLQARTSIVPKVKPPPPFLGKLEKR